MTSLGSPIASGRTSQIYPWEEGLVVKLYPAGTPADELESERQKTALAHDAGLPVPGPGDVVEISGRPGLVLQRLEGPSMMQLLLTDPDAVEPMARRLAEMHLELHGREGFSALPSQNARLRARIEQSPLLSPGEQKGLLERLARLPGGDRLCHGDFHPGNVILTEAGPYIIDWVDASRGNPLADVARTAILFRGQIESARADDGFLEGMRRYYRTYLESYLGADPKRWAEFRQWVPVVAGARLAENISEQQEWLLKVARAERLAGESPGQ